MTEQAEKDIAELKEIRVNFRWDKEHLAVVKKAAEVIGVLWRPLTSCLSRRALTEDISARGAKLPEACRVHLPYFLPLQYKQIPFVLVRSQTLWLQEWPCGHSHQANFLDLPWMSLGRIPWFFVLSHCLATCGYKVDRELVTET
jgi:hypothetical protein